MNWLQKSLVDIKHFKLAYILFFVIYTIFCSLVVANYTQAMTQNITQLGFCYGPLITNLLRSGDFLTCNSPFYPDICFGAHRLPIIPYLLILIQKITSTNHCFYIYFIKNMLFIPFLGMGLWKIIKHYKLHTFHAMIMAIPLITPQFILHTFNIAYEEGYATPLFVYVFCCLLVADPTKDNLSMFVATGLLLLTKHSFVYVCPLIPILYFIKTRHLKYTFLGVFVVGIFALFLALFSFRWSGKFTLQSSWTGLNLYKGNNEQTLNYYPEYTLDILDDIRTEFPPLSIVKNEWDYDRYYRQKAFEHIKKHPVETAKLVAIKAYVMYISIAPNGKTLAQNQSNPKIKIIGSVFMLFNRLVMCTLIVLLLFKLKIWTLHRDFVHNLIIYLMLLASYSFSYLAGFAYERHVMPTLLLHACMLAVGLKTFTKPKVQGMLLQ